MAIGAHRKAYYNNRYIVKEQAGDKVACIMLLVCLLLSKKLTRQVFRNGDINQTIHKGK
jgi:hypothetical protein